ncbi:MAG TPA: FAD binding domain-containing protein [Vicinamibacterales bacterium]|jgi:xanthine dehydrogenase YagS FAD-binding subunit
MKSFANTSPKTLAQAHAAIGAARQAGKSMALAGGGSDLLGQMKERLVAPDVVVHLRSIRGLDRIEVAAHTITIGGLATLDAVARHPAVRKQLTVLAEAAESVATPQIRNVGTIAGNVNQRPWCWYYRNGFKCFKNGGNRCYSADGENQFHAIFGGGPSYIVHPSDTAVALVALDATFVVGGPSGTRSVKAADFFTLPAANPARENTLKDGEILESIEIPVPRASVRSMYHKIMDREAWTHAIVAAAVVMDVDNGVCRSARVVLGGVAPIPWRLADVEKLLAGKRITPEVAAEAGEAATAGARALAKNAYKIPMTRAMVRRTIVEVAAKA